MTNVRSGPMFQQQMYSFRVQGVGSNCKWGSVFMKQVISWNMQIVDTIKTCKVTERNLLSVRLLAKCLLSKYLVQEKITSKSGKLLRCICGRTSAFGVVTGSVPRSLLNIMDCKGTDVKQRPMQTNVI